MDSSMKVCQSCGMPLEGNELLGTNADGSKNEDYCMYCFEKGEFKYEITMNEMIEFCIPHMIKANPDLNERQARDYMEKIFPKLKRWL